MFSKNKPRIFVFEGANDEQLAELHGSLKNIGVKNFIVISVEPTKIIELE